MGCRYLNHVNLKVVLLGSSRLLLRKGLTESLAGRFELIRMGHWTFPEMKAAFGLSLQQWIYFGGYPGSVDYIGILGVGGNMSRILLWHLPLKRMFS